MGELYIQYLLPGLILIHLPLKIFFVLLKYWKSYLVDNPKSDF
jgi:hypothetical protein